jgi:hypothetical protein
MAARFCRRHPCRDTSWIPTSYIGFQIVLRELQQCFNRQTLPTGGLTFDVQHAGTDAKEKNSELSKCPHRFKAIRLPTISDGKRGSDVSNTKDFSKDYFNRGSAFAFQDQVSNPGRIGNCPRGQGPPVDPAVKCWAISNSTDERPKEDPIKRDHMQFFVQLAHMPAKGRSYLIFIFPGGHFPKNWQSVRVSPSHFAPFWLC